VINSFSFESILLKIISFEIKKMGLFDLFKGKNKLTEYLQNGAIIIDVRTPQEFRAGHVKGAKNIPLQDLNR